LKALPVLAAVALSLSETARAQVALTIDSVDQQTLERALYLCTWKTLHEVPETSPTPAVCRRAAVSVDDAMLQDKQWWTFWARLNPEEALKANQNFSADFAGFRSRVQVNPELAEQLLPPGIKLRKGDWRLWLIHKLGPR
jgi:hypothetical protein